jgi:hypothetical protein
VLIIRYKYDYSPAIKTKLPCSGSGAKSAANCIDAPAQLTIRHPPRLTAICRHAQAQIFTQSSSVFEWLGYSASTKDKAPISLANLVSYSNSRKKGVAGFYGII